MKIALSYILSNIHHPLHTALVREEGAVAASTQQPRSHSHGALEETTTYAALVHHGLNQFSPNALSVHQAGGYTPHLVNTGIHVSPYRTTSVKSMTLTNRPGATEKKRTWTGIVTSITSV